jgi:hypothetical protein
VGEPILTLRDLFEVDTKDIAIRVAPGLDAYQAVQDARQKIAQESRAIQWSWVRQAVAEGAQDLLQLNVVDVLVNAWKKFMQIEQYADPFKYNAGEKILAPLAEHTLKSEHQPSVQILLQGHEVGSVKFDLHFSLTLEGFVLVIQNARILEIQTGSGKGEGSLSLTEISLWKRELKPVRFPGHISLGNGIPLGRG